MELSTQYWLTSKKNDADIVQAKAFPAKQLRNVIAGHSPPQRCRSWICGEEWACCNGVVVSRAVAVVASLINIKML